MWTGGSFASAFGLVARQAVATTFFAAPAAASAWNALINMKMLQMFG